MADNSQGSKVVSGTKNVIYSVLVFFASAMIGVALLDPSSFNNTGGEAKIGRGTILAIGLSVAVTIAFSMWLSKRNKN